MESKKGIKIAQLEEKNAQDGFRIAAHKVALVRPIGWDHENSVSNLLSF